MAKFLNRLRTLTFFSKSAAKTELKVNPLTPKILKGPASEKPYYSFISGGKDFLEKTSQQMINEVPPIEVDGDSAFCDGGGLRALGHPIEYLQLNKTRPNEPEVCKYCGLRYIQKGHGSHP